jgi:hypothetical protein
MVRAVALARSRWLSGRARLGSDNAGTAAAKCSRMTDRTANEAHFVDRYSRSKPMTQGHVFMELWQARCVQGYVAVKRCERNAQLTKRAAKTASRYRRDQPPAGGGGTTPP